MHDEANSSLISLLEVLKFVNLV